MILKKQFMILSIIFAVTLFITAAVFAQAPNRPSNEGISQQEAYSLAQTDTSHYAGLLEKVKAEGKIRIIVGVKASFIPEGWHRTAERVAEQRTGITRAQESLLKAIRIPDENSVKKFKYIPFVAMEVDEAGLQSLMNNPMVNSIEEDKLNSPMLYDTIPQIGANTGEANYYTGYTGKGQTIAILDTGVDKTHPFLSGKVVEEACFSSVASSLCPNGQTYQIGSGSGVNCPSYISGCDHGTHVAGIAAGKLTLCNDGTYCMRGVAPKANIIVIQVFHRVDDASVCAQNHGESSPCVRSYDSDYNAALQHVYDLRNSYNIASVNMSLGSGWYPSNCDDASAKAMIDQLRSVGIATVISSGNEGYSNGIGSPACISTAVSVGATNMYLGTEDVTGYSNSASFLSLLAPGGYGGFWSSFSFSGCNSSFGIYSSIPGGGWCTMVGTSMAAPLVAGAWALMKEKNPTASVDTILSKLQGTGRYFYDSKSGVTTRRIQVNSALAALPVLPKSPVYRFYNTQAGFFMFTIYESEKDYILQNLPYYQNNGVSFYAYPTQQPGTLPVYRFYNTLAGFFMFTIYESEKDYILQNLPYYQLNGVSFYAYPTQQPGTLPVYRFYNTQAGFFMFTIYESEKDYILQNLPYYQLNGVSFYAYPNP